MFKMDRWVTCINEPASRPIVWVVIWKDIIQQIKCSSYDHIIYEINPLSDSLQINFDSV